MKRSAGILVYRLRSEREFFLVHPGGPFFRSKDLGVWTIPKGEINDNEEALVAAQREFFEETGTKLHGPFLELKSIKQKSGKIVYAWAAEQDIDEMKIFSNHFLVEWPPKSGKQQSFPEVDKAGWFTMQEAKLKIIEAQAGLLMQLEEVIK